MFRQLTEKELAGINMVNEYIENKTPLSWNETKELSTYVCERAVEQFIDLYHEWNDRDGDEFKWGDEVEHTVVKFDDKNKIAYLSLCAKKLLDSLKTKQIDDSTVAKSSWSYEYTSYIVESSPGQPYEHLSDYINEVEENMNYRRREINELLPKDEVIMTITNFVRLGAPKFTWPVYEPKPNSETSFNRSLYIPDEIILPDGFRRFFTRNVLLRRGGKVNVNATVFKDENTKIPVEGSSADKPDTVFMDATVFGFGCCSLQTTFQARDLNEARVLYDQLAALGPIMIALTAATTAFRGYLIDSDCRWNITKGATDARTPEERGEVPLSENGYRANRCNYDTIHSYISLNSERYNDEALVHNEKHYQKLRDAGVDHTLAQHITNLYLTARPLVLYEETVHANDEGGKCHYHTIQSASYRSIRIKAPSRNPSIGWRVEFRPCELQITDFDNAAVAIFMALITRVILFYNLNFLIPISKLHENMETAQKRNAYRTGRFWFQKNIYGTQTNGVNGNVSPGEEFQLMTINEIINGNGSSFPGLIPLIYKYLATLNVDTDTYNKLERYLQLIQHRASGDLLTVASWIRQEVLNHPDYKKDSVVTKRINYDLLKKIKAIQEGVIHCTELHGSLYPAQ